MDPKEIIEMIQDGIMGIKSLIIPPNITVTTRKLVNSNTEYTLIDKFESDVMLWELHNMSATRAMRVRFDEPSDGANEVDESKEIPLGDIEDYHGHIVRRTRPDGIWVRFTEDPGANNDYVHLVKWLYMSREGKFTEKRKSRKDDYKDGGLIARLSKKRRG